VIGNDTTVKDNTWVTDSSIISDNVIIGSSNKLKHGIKVWAGKTIEDNAISF
jgi:UDP-3-O-[3-hydroxymyristoyl] glucosamine N-acyltransferase